MSARPPDPRKPPRRRRVRGRQEGGGGAESGRPRRPPALRPGCGHALTVRTTRRLRSMRRCRPCSRGDPPKHGCPARSRAAARALSRSCALHWSIRAATLRDGTRCPRKKPTLWQVTATSCDQGLSGETAGGVHDSICGDFDSEIHRVATPSAWWVLAACRCWRDQQHTRPQQMTMLPR